MRCWCMLLILASLKTVVKGSGRCFQQGNCQEKEGKLFIIVFVLYKQICIIHTGCPDPSILLSILSTNFTFYRPITEPIDLSLY